MLQLPVVTTNNVQTEKLLAGVETAAAKFAIVILNDWVYRWLFLSVPSDPRGWPALEVDGEGESESCMPILSSDTS